MAIAKVKALKVFYVSYSNIRLKVRILPHSRDVFTEYSGGKKWRMRDELPQGFFEATTNPYAKYLGTIVIAGNSDLNDVVPHEVFHAVLCKMRQVHTDNDEVAAYAIGVLTSRILKKAKRSIEMGE